MSAWVLVGDCSSDTEEIARTCSALSSHKEEKMNIFETFLFIMYWVRGAFETLSETFAFYGAMAVIACSLLFLSCIIRRRGKT